MGELDLDAIRDRADGATEAPWIAVSDNGRKSGIALIGRAADRGTGRAIAVLAGVDVAQRHRDAEFLAAARTDVSDLIAEIERLRAELATVTGERDDALQMLDELQFGPAADVLTESTPDSGSGS